MDFFARQTAMRGLSRRLVLLFLLAVFTVVAIVDAVILTAIASLQPESTGLMLPTAAWLAAHSGVVIVTTLGVIGTIAVASLYKTSALRSGGGVVATSLGGERVLPATTDPLRRRLLNVVEEIAIASGVPPPEVYVLEHEPGINAFAAGHSPANAAIAVTRGALDTLNRAELQGVIAHEFSHVLNGDMRLNIRLMGLLFGLLVIAVVARTVLRLAPRGGHRGGNKGGGVLAAIMAAAFAVLIVGYVGLLFGRLIQAAVSRGRESLADASAIQFTRDPTGLRGALIKIGAISAGSKLQDADADEVAHMLFASGMNRAFATHPPLVDRIKAIDPRFDPHEFEQARARIATERAQGEQEAAAEAKPTAADKLQNMLGTAVSATPMVIAQLVGNPGTRQIEMAHSIRESLPADIVAAAERLPDATALFFSLALDRDPATREQQINFLRQQLGPELAARVHHWLPAADRLSVIQRQPVLLRLLPALRQSSTAERERLLACLNGLLIREGRVSIEAYALRKLAQVHLRDGTNARPGNAALALPSAMAELGILFAVLAKHGDEDAVNARRAYEAGLHTLLPQRRPAYAPPDNWPAQLDAALDKLDRLAPAAKAMLVEALVTTISHDGRLTSHEAELLRAICASLQCPLPPLMDSIGAGA